MKQKTYGAPRYMDWQALVKAGRAKIRIHFTGGSLTVYGATPAEYTTRNEFIQQAIEMSDYFRDGRIVLLREHEIESGKKCVNGKKRDGASGFRPHTAAVAAGAGAGADGADGADTEAAGAGAEGDEADAECIGAEAEAGSGTEEVLIEVSCLQDAQDYLQQEFGIASYRVRTIAAAQRVAGEHGVRFSGGGFE